MELIRGEMNHQEGSEKFEDEEDEENESENSDYGSRGGATGAEYEDSAEFSSDSYGRSKNNRSKKKKRQLNNGLNVEFYYDFCGFLPGKELNSYF